jgi:hypothetical protein
MSASSPNNTTIVAGIVDVTGNIWSLNDAGHVCVNYVADTTTKNVIQLAYVGGKIWQQNAQLIWWYKTTTTSPWLPTNGTTVSPLPTAPGAPTAVSAK